MCHLVREALQNLEDRKCRPLIDNKFKNLVLSLFGEAQQPVTESVYAPEMEVIKQAVVNAFFTGGTDELLANKMIMLA